MLLDFWTAPALDALPGVQHGFSRRIGGVSVAPFDSLNLGLHVDDDDLAVRENRARVAAHFGLDLGRMVCAEQVHGGAVAVVGVADAGRGAAILSGAVPGVDALITDTPDLLLALFFADCVPVFFASASGAVGVAHAGWRGLAANVLENTLRTFAESLGAKAATMHVAIGACIGAEAFAVGKEVAALFASDACIGADGKPRVDLAGAAVRRLCAAGVPPAQITVSGECTASLPERYFSHRGQNGRTGRMGALITKC
ncbi:MAG: peptidoglycan editing factor PgeF [Armatimonadetes bacterium]|nr:peptidoglycan editing factor PgeF [Armatimonadota bacterium]